MQGHIRERGKNAYEISYPVGRNEKGNQVRKYETIRGTKKEAQARLSQILAGLSTGDFVAPGKETVSAYMARWLEEIRPSLAPKTYRWYEQMVRLYINPRLGKTLLAKLSALQVQAFYRQLLADGRTGSTATGEPGEGLSPKTVQGVSRALNVALNQAAAWQLLSKNPAIHAERPAVPKKQMKTLSADEAKKLLEASRPTGRYGLYLAALMTGMRQGELLGLRWADVDLENEVISVRQQLDSKTKETFREPKTRTGTRAVKMAAPLKKALLEQWEEEMLCRQLPDFVSRDLVWHTSTGAPIGPRNLSRQFKLLLTKAGLPDIRFHDLRHSCATILLSQKVPLKIVQEILGHSQFSVTADFYSHVSVAMQEIATDAVGKLFEDDPKCTEDKPDKPNRDKH